MTHSNRNTTHKPITIGPSGYAWHAEFQDEVSREVVVWALCRYVNQNDNHHTQAEEVHGYVVTESGTVECAQSFKNFERYAL